MRILEPNGPPRLDGRCWNTNKRRECNQESSSLTPLAVVKRVAVPIGRPLLVPGARRRKTSFNRSITSLHQTLWISRCCRNCTRHTSSFNKQMINSICFTPYCPEFIVLATQCFFFSSRNIDVVL